MPKQSVSYIKCEEPEFIKKLKSRLGVEKDDDIDIETKRARLDKPEHPELDEENEDLFYKNEEHPQYVVSDNSVTEAEVREYLAKKTAQKQQASEKKRLVSTVEPMPAAADEDGQAKIEFRKPNRSEAAAAPKRHQTSSAAARADSLRQTMAKVDDIRSRDSRKAAGRSLLSFDDGEGDEDESDERTT